jgi:hypothetical protein
VPPADLSADPSTIEDGRPDELAARHGMTIPEVRRVIVVGREDALRLLAELGDVQGRLDDLKRRLRELAEG